MQTKDLLDGNMKIAKNAIDNGDYNRAVMYMRLCAINCMELAKSSAGKTRADYYDKGKALLATIEELEAKAMLQPKSTASADAKNVGANKNANIGANNAINAASIDTKNTPSADVTVSNSGFDVAKTFSPTDNTGSAIRPKKLSDFVGQPQAVVAVKDSIAAAKLRNTALQHTIVYGSHGLGKTTFARIIAAEMNVNFVEINVSKLTSKELIKVLSSLQDRDIVFIDEIHNLPKETAESVLYSAMEDFQVCFVEKCGDEVKTINIQLPRFTLIGATTEAGKLPKPLLARAQIQCRLVSYTDEVLAQIVTKSFAKLGMKIDDDDALDVAKRCRHNPRIANRHVSRIADKSLCEYASSMDVAPENGSLKSENAVKDLNIVISHDVVSAYFDENGIDGLGLEEGDRSLLKRLICDFDGGPTSLDTLARAMNESVNVIEDKYEDCLLRCGMIKITAGGRVATRRAYDHLGVAYSKSYDTINSKSDDTANNKPEDTANNKSDDTAKSYADGDASSKTDSVAERPKGDAKDTYAGKIKDDVENTTADRPMGDVENTTADKTNDD